MSPSFRWWQQWIYYPTYSRLDALTIGVALAAIEHFRREWWANLMKSATWIWLPGLAGIVWAMVMAENGLSITSSALGFLLVAIGAGTFLICAVSPRLPVSRTEVPGAAYTATMAYSVYLSHKLAIHWTEQVMVSHSIPATPAYSIMLVAICVVGSALFFGVERPFLKLRHKLIQKTKRSDER